MPAPQQSSYQKAEISFSEDSSLLSTSDFLNMQHRKRNRFCFMLALFSSVLVLTAAAAVWKVQQGKKELVPTKTISKKAAGALSTLNKHLNHQSKQISAMCESTIMLTRHCEKVGPNVKDADGNVHCSHLGFERASFLATLFGSSKDARWPTPSHLFALTPDRGKHLNFRELESLSPLSKATGISTDVMNRPADLAEAYFSLLQSGDLCGKLTVVSWKHDDMPKLATLLGCEPENGCPDFYPDDEFDQVWQLKYVFHPIVPDLGEVKDSERGSRFMSSEKGWSVFATVTKQNFDPLSFRKQAGDYPDDEYF